MPLQGENVILWTLPKVLLVGAFWTIWLSNRSFYFPRESYWLIAFVVVSLISSSLSIFPFVALREWITILLCLPVFLVSYNLFIRIPEKQNVFLLGLCVVTLFYSFGYLLPFLDVDQVGRFGRFQGITGNPNGLATFSLLSSLLLLSFALTKDNLSYRIIFAALAVLFFAIVVQTGSRKFVIYFAASILIAPFVFSRTFEGFLKLVFGIFILVVIGYFSYQFIDFSVLESRFAIYEVERAFTTRLSLYGDAFARIGDRIFVGHGIGTFAHFSPFGIPAHGQVPETLYSTGVFGFFVLTIFYLMIGYKLVKKWLKQRSDLSSSSDLLFYLCVVMMFAGFHYFDSPFHFFVMGYLLASAQPVMFFNPRKENAHFRHLEQLPSS